MSRCCPIWLAVPSDGEPGSPGLDGPEEGPAAAAEGHRKRSRSRKAPETGMYVRLNYRAGVDQGDFAQPPSI